jgi:mannosyl-3-phosphoglycerate phosphatase family protein
VSDAPGSCLFFTDLDGTLLDEETYDVAPARPGLDALRAHRIALVLCSSKTRAEMAPLADELDLETPLIVENGGALVLSVGALPAFPPGARHEGGRVVVPLGRPRRELLAALPDVAASAGVAVRPFAAMSVQEIGAMTGLPPEAAARAAEREWDEPFVVETEAGPETDARLQAAARRHGMRVTRGGRFRHLTGTSDKGDAARMLLRLLPLGPGGRTVGLGDAANDLPLLKAVDRPIVMPRRRGGIDPTLAAALPRAERARAAGPGGWAAAVLDVLAGASLPRVGES